MYDLIVIGGGPAGTATAITAARLITPGTILLLERGSFPRPKVCGEFVSSEALDLLRELLAEDIGLLNRAPRITCARVFVNKQEIAFAIKPAAASISRWDLDEALWRGAARSGVECREKTGVKSVRRTSAGFVVATSAGEFHGRAVVDASGRWSRLRATPPAHAGATRKSPPWIGLKAHYTHLPVAGRQSPSRAGEAATDLYFFESGYCGVQPVGAGRLNVCAMVKASHAAHLADVFPLHASLHERSRAWTQASDPVAVAPLDFIPAIAEHNGVLRAGDAAAFIDPFAGDGISLALRSGKLAAESLAHFWQNRISFDEAAGKYRRGYQQCFTPALRAAARLRKVLAAPAPIQSLLLLALRLPGVAEFAVRATR